MAALAAGGVLLTIQEQRDATELVNFENNFFSLLSHFQSIVLNTEVYHFEKENPSDPDSSTELRFTLRGHQAFKYILDELHKEIETDDFDEYLKLLFVYQEFFEQWQDELGHYFRLLYHLVSLVEKRCPAKYDPYYYIQLVRAQLSQPEMTLVAYNCSFGEGYEKFAEKISNFHMLHNFGISSDRFLSAEREMLKKRLGSQAFETPSSNQNKDSMNSYSRESCARWCQLAFESQGPLDQQGVLDYVFENYRSEIMNHPVAKTKWQLDVRRELLNAHRRGELLRSATGKFSIP